MAYYRVDKKVSEYCYESVGLLYGNREAIKCYYASKSIEIATRRINLIDQKGNQVDEIEYGQTIWRWPTENDLFTIGASYEEAKKSYQLYCMKNGVSFCECLPLIKVDIPRCSLVDGKLDIVN